MEGAQLRHKAAEGEAAARTHELCPYAPSAFARRRPRTKAQRYRGAQAFSSLQLIDTFAYLAFKALAGRYPDALKSAQQNTRWKLDATLGLPCLKAAKRTFRDGHGVYAATVEEAQRYAEDHQAAVYLVAPLQGKHAVVGERGWRAEAAVCLGPLTEENAPQIVRLVLTAHWYGIPQVKGVLR